MNLIIIATSKALHMNLSIYQKGPDRNINVTEQTTDARGREAYIDIYIGPHNPAQNHYSAILLFEKSGQVFDHD